MDRLDLGPAKRLGDGMLIGGMQMIIKVEVVEGLQMGGGSAFNSPMPITQLPDYQANLNFGQSGASSQYRNDPDISAESDNDNYYCLTGDGSVYPTGPSCSVGSASVLAGTSIAAPTWAGFIALMNEQAATNGLPVMGFLNPALYQIANGVPGSFAFNDPIGGTNSYMQGEPGYAAISGYDLATGLGSPHFSLGFQVVSDCFQVGSFGGLINDINVSISSTQGSGPIYYTLDGTIPTTSSQLYSSSIQLTQPTTVTAMFGGNVARTLASCTLQHT